MNFKEQLIFKLEKDKPINSMEEFKIYISKHYGKSVDLSWLYRNIVNYQIKRYGKQLISTVTFLSYEEKQKRSHICRCERNQRKRGHR